MIVLCREVVLFSANREIKLIIVLFDSFPLSMDKDTLKQHESLKGKTCMYIVYCQGLILSIHYKYRFFQRTYRLQGEEGM